MLSTTHKTRGFKLRELVLFLTLISVAGTAAAQSTCDAIYKFDGDLSDAGGNGYGGTAFGRDDQPATPQFGEGISGQALLFDGTTAIRTGLNLHFDGCPQVTVTGWLRLNTREPNGQNYIFSVGDWGPLGVSANARSIVLRGRGGGLQIKNALRDERAWFFFAGVYDFDAGTYKLRFRNRTIEGKLPESPREPAAETFFGARDEHLTSPARDIYLDEVTIVGRALSDDEISRVAAQVTSRPWLTAIAHSDIQNAGEQTQITLPDSARGNRPPIGPTTLPEVGESSDGPRLDAGPAGVTGPETGLESGPETGLAAGLVANLSLDGEWVRRDSNNNPNDGMLINVSNGQAVLTYVPPTASSNWHEGEVLWQNIGSEGTLEVLGSNNAYYDAEIIVEAANIVHIDIDANGRGNDQSWERITPAELPGDQFDLRSPPGDQEDQGPMLEAGPAGNTGRDPGLSAPDDLPGPFEPLDTLPPEDPVNEIVCEAITGSLPRVWRQGSFPTDFVSAIGKARECGLKVTVATANRSDQWIVATADQIAHSTGLPADLRTSLGEFEYNHGGLDAADIGEDGGWAIISGSNIATGNLNAGTAAQIEQLATGASGVISLDFFPGDSSRWVAVTEGGGVLGPGATDNLIRALPNRAMTQRNVHQVRLTDSGWLMLGTDYWYATQNVGGSTRGVLKAHQRSGSRLDHVVLGNSGNEYLTYSVGPEPNRFGDLIQDVEEGVNNQTIWARMEAWDLPGVSIAMVRNNEIAWARAYGIGNADEPESYINIETTFDAASISKPIAAFGLLQLVEDGELSLTEEGVLNDLDDLFDNRLQRTLFNGLDPDTGNLIQLLQHCIDVRYNSGGSAAEYSLNESIPTTAEMIFGTGRAKQSHSLRRGNNSGNVSNYTSANFMLVQGLIDVHGGGLLNHINPLLASLGMNRATYMSPYPQRNGNFARGWDGTTVTDMFGYGEMAAASLVARPIDIARFVIAVNELLANSNATQPLSNQYARWFIGLDDVTDTSNDYPVCNDDIDHGFGSQLWGLGVRYGNANWSNTDYYTHGGIHNGYRTFMFGFHEIRSGIVVFINSDEDDTDGRNKADKFFGELRGAVVSAYDPAFVADGF